MTKEEFLVVYNENLPCKYTKFVYRLNGMTVDGKEGLRKYIYPLLVIMFFVGFFSTIFELPDAIIKYSTLGFVFIITPVVLSIFVGVFLNRFRIKRIMKKLDIKDTEEYNDYTLMYIKNER